MSALFSGVTELILITFCVAMVVLAIRLFWSKRPRSRTATSSRFMSAVDDIEPDRIKRMLKSLNISDKTGLAVKAAVLLTFAQFVTTWLGLSHFMPSAVVAFIAAIGIQTILYLSAWLVAEKYADWMYFNHKRKEERFGIGDETELARAEVAYKSTGWAWRIVMFSMALTVSVSFSFVALFDRIYLPERQTLNNLKVARSSIGAVFGTTGTKIEDDRRAELTTLINSKEWKTWRDNFNTVLTTAEGSRDTLENAWRAITSKLEFDASDASKKLLAARTVKSELENQLAVIGIQQAAPSGRVENPVTDIARFEKRREQLSTIIGELEKQRADVDLTLSKEIRGEIPREDGKPGLPGDKGRAAKIRGKRNSIDADLKVRRSELATVDKSIRDANEKAAKAATTAEIAKAEGGQRRAVKQSEIEAQQNVVERLEREEFQAKKILVAHAGDAKGATGSTTGVGDQVSSLRRASTAFIGTGSADDYAQMLNGCNSLVEMLGRQESTKQKLGAIDCDATSLAPRITKLSAFDAALKKYGDACKVDDAFNAITDVKGMVDRARVCTGLSSLPFSRIAAERDEIDRIEQENSPATSHFERAKSTLSRLDPLAWFALALAFTLDFLIFVAAMLGAQAANRPLSAAALENVLSAADADPNIYASDSKRIQALKNMLSMVRDDFESLASSNPGEDSVIVDLQSVDADVRLIVQPMLSTYVTMKLARLKRPDVYMLSNDLLRTLIREVARYEQDPNRNRANSRPEGSRGEDSGRRPGAFNDDSGLPDEDIDVLRRRRNEAKADFRQQGPTPQTAAESATEELRGVSSMSDVSIPWRARAS